MIEEVFQLLDDVRVRRGDVIVLADVGLQVVEFAAGVELPVTAADGAEAVPTVVEEGLVRRLRARFAFE